MMRLYGSKRALIASRESGSPKITLATVELPEGIAHLKWADTGAGGADTYLFPSAAIAWYARKVPRREGEYNGLGLNGEGALRRYSHRCLHPRFAAQHNFERVLAVSFHRGPTCRAEYFSSSLS